MIRSSPAHAVAADGRSHHRAAPLVAGRHASRPRSCAPAGRSFLLYPNYEAILGYNCAHTYALSVALLSDQSSLACCRATSAIRRLHCVYTFVSVDTTHDTHKSHGDIRLLTSDLRCPLDAQTGGAPATIAQDLKRLSIEELAQIDVTSVSRRAEKLSATAAAVSVIESRRHLPQRRDQSRRDAAARRCG